MLQISPTIRALVLALIATASTQIGLSPAWGRVVEADVCVFGGTSGGVVAAVQAARMGRRAVLVEPGRHLGGMTAGGLCAVDIGDPRSVGGIAREYFTRLASAYGKSLAWDQPFQSKGGEPATGGAFAIEPHTAENLFNQMLRDARVPVELDQRLAGVRKIGPRIVEIVTESGTLLRARMFLDATYEGDLMAEAGISYTLQREGNTQYGEKFNGIHYSPKFLPRTDYAPPGANGRLPGGQGVWDRDVPLDPYVVPGNPASGLLPWVQAGEPGEEGSPAPGVQAYCYRLCLTTAADRRSIAPPADYDPRRYEIVARFIAACQKMGDDIDLRWFSKYDPLPHDKWDFNTATFGANLPGASWEWPAATYARRVEIAKQHENYHRGLLRFLATDPRVPDRVRQQIERFGLPRDEFTDNGGWPHQLYIREARRMVSDLVMTEHHTFGRQVAPQSIGLGSYGTDTHEIRRIVRDGVVTREGKTAGGRDGAPPYPIGYGAIVPKAGQCENLLVTFALSASHTAFSSIRMEPVFMVTSQSAATAACLALDDGGPVQGLNYDRLRTRLEQDGQVLQWRQPASEPRPQKAAPAAKAPAKVVEVFRADDNWRPIRWEPARVVRGSALDVSSLLEAPAGKFGPVVCRDGQFVFRAAPHKPLRIYGTDITHALPYIDKRRCEQLADYLAACGYSGVRLHNYTFAKGVLPEPGATRLAPEAEDQLDYFFSCLKQRGIYYTLPINSWGFFKAGDVQDVAEFRNRAFRFESNALLPISQDLQRWFKAFAAHLLGHTNRYTGLPLKDDPALLSLELANEDSLFAVLGHNPEFVEIYRRLCRQHEQARLGREPSAGEVDKALPGYVVELQEKYCRDMQAFLRSLGVRQPLTDLNFRDNLIYALPRSQLDYVDIHAYWALYHNLSGVWPNNETTYRQTWTNPNAIGWNTILGPVAGRLFGKPYVCSEYNGCYATPYWCYTGPVEAALAGAQGWNAVFRCGPEAQPERFFQAAAVRRIATSSNPLLMFAERIGGLLMGQGEIQPLPVKVPLVLTPEYLMTRLDIQGGPRYPPSYSQLAFQYQIGTIVLDGHQRLDGYPCLVAPADMQLPAALTKRTVLRADADLPKRLAAILSTESQRPAGAMKLDIANGTAQIVTPRTATLLLPAEVEHAATETLRVTGNHTVAVCFAGSLDGRALAESNRMLVLYLTDLKNTGTEVEHQPKPAGTVIVRAAGTLPLLVRQGKIEVTFKTADRPLPRVWALKYDGSRAAAVQPRRTPDGFAFDAQAVTDPETFAAYELTWTK